MDEKDIRIWAIERATLCLAKEKYPEPGHIMTLAMLFEDYVKEGSQAETVKAVMKS